MMLLGHLQLQVRYIHVFYVAVMTSYQTLSFSGHYATNIDMIEWVDNRTHIYR